jgi:4-hydroxybenzoate polyprenyltransferase
MKRVGFGDVKQGLLHIYKYIRLVRWPNLLVVAFTMVMLRAYLISPLLQSEGHLSAMPWWLFLLLVMSVLLIMAAGYVINDYFDVRIDQVNRNKRVILGAIIPVRHAIPLHATLTALGIVIGVFVSVVTGTITLVFVHLIAGLLLWMYSARYKRQPVWGNLVVAILSALVLLIVWLFEFMAMANQGIFILNRAEFSWVNQAVIFFALFAFVLTMIREMVKDMQDLEGDKRYGCRTLPVVIGVRSVKWIVLAIIAIAMIGLFGVQLLLWSNHLPLTAWYFMVVQVMMGYLAVRLHKASLPDEFEALSQLARLIMVAGVLSLQIYHIDA